MNKKIIGALMLLAIPASFFGYIFWHDGIKMFLEIFGVTIASLVYTSFAVRLIIR